MKKMMFNTLKLMLILLIFIGLQSRVIVRFFEVTNTDKITVQTRFAHPVIQKGIVHCKLQCYTQHFQTAGIPAIPFLLIIILFLISNTPVFVNSDEAAEATNWHIPRTLRGPPLTLWTQ
jgi:hypothetical protein